MNNGIVLTVKGACPCCGEELSSMHYMWGGALFIFFHARGDFEGVSSPLEELRLCRIDRTTGECIRRNYELPAEQVA